MIKAKVESLLAKAFDNQLQDAVKQFMLKSRNSDGENFSNHKSRGVFEAYKSEEIARSQGAIVNGDEQLIVLQSELSAVPKIADLIVVLVANKIELQYRVQNITPDPTDSIWQIHVRA